MARIVWTRRARSDLLRLRDFLAAENPDAAAKAVRSIRDGLHTLKTAPDAGRKVEWLPDGYREWLIPLEKADTRCFIDSWTVK